MSIMFPFPKHMLPKYFHFLTNIFPMPNLMAQGHIEIFKGDGQPRVEAPLI